MSDDSKENPPAKLRLSRDLRPPSQPEEAKSENTKAGDAEKKPRIQLKRRAEREPEASPPEENSPKPVSETSDQSSKSETGTENPGFDPTKPFGHAIKRNEIRRPTTPGGPNTPGGPSEPQNPRPQPPPQAPPPLRGNPGSGLKVEEAIHSYQKEEAVATNHHSILPSVIVILLLFGLLGGAGYGLWLVLQSPSEQNAGEVANDPATGDPARSNPIERAKAVIKKIPVAELEAVTNDLDGKTPDEKRAEIAQEAQGGEPVSENFEPALLAPKVEAKLEEVSDPPPASPTNKAIEANKQNVSLYLSNVHIDGVRTGEQPVVMIKGQRYVVGDLLHPETGLKFDGLQKGRLAFRDRHGIVYLRSF